MTNPSLRDLIYRWMEIPKFWEEEFAKDFEPYYQRWSRDKLCGLCVGRIKSMAKIILHEIAKSDLKEYLIEIYGIPSISQFEKFLSDPFAYADSPLADAIHSVHSKHQ